MAWNEPVRVPRSVVGARDLLGFVGATLGPAPLLTSSGGDAVSFPSQFSFIEDPDAAVGALADLTRRCQTDDARIVLDQEPCVRVDYCASSVAFALAYAATKGHNVGFRWKPPKDDEQSVIAVATGLPQQFKVAPPVQSFITFPLHAGRKDIDRATVVSERERVADRFTRYLEGCLRGYGFKLDRDGYGLVGGLLGEVIGNAENHGGRDEWWIGGYLRQRPDGFGDCHLTIFNFGRTIYQTMQQLPADALLRRQIEGLVDHHTRLGTFGRGYGEEELWTLYAMQAGASRKQESPTGLDLDRGRGLADLTTYFQRLGAVGPDGSQPEMCLVSGHSHLRFDHRYEMKEEIVDGDSLRIIAFNGANDLRQPPDRRNVRRLRTFFPGTLVSMRFHIGRDLDASASS